ncbi:ADP-ribose diphosphatase [Sporosarcina sp. NCCP-2222]|uniref:NUDIX hydrolase n=1 Tax=Sporosarcina sp. NCCP-2222 TaxID=2935073 RepID=UPI002085382E|nr:NUDIX hydrolase [Sporosarcina sp. NCCP-2222]GKV55485.1 ADP-ribose diphosphatase [Sporosarcina sp. NCCP-2222]
MIHTEKTVASKTIYEGKVISLRVEDVELPDGKLAKRELVKHPGAVAVLAVTAEGKLVFVRQFRKALERTLVEIPAGKIEPGEDKRITAIRELEEETGYHAQQFEYIQSFATSPGFADEVIHLYVATGLQKVENPAAGDEDEFIDILECTIEEAEQLVADGQIFDAKTLYAILYAKNMK